MKTFTVLLLKMAFLTALSGQSKVNVYYFHTKTRCVTCRAVEAEARKNIEKLFGDEVQFTAVNLDEEDGEAISKEMGVNSLRLLVVKGDRKIDLTNQGFMYARLDPPKFRQIMKENIEPLL